MLVGLVVLFVVLVLLSARRRLLLGRYRRGGGGARWEAATRLPVGFRGDIRDVAERANYRGVLTILRDRNALRFIARPPVSSLVAQQLENVLGQYVVDGARVRSKVRRSSAL